MKVLLCAIGKEENQYIREWVEYYKSINFDNIWLYDNNDPDGERFEDVIGDYIDSGFVRVIDYRGRKECQFDAYNECYAAAGKDFDWIAFFDCDEFLELKKKKDIHHQLALSKFKGFQAIHVNWLSYGDCGQLHYEDKPLLERFTEPVTPLNFQKMSFPENNHIKTIARTGIPNVSFCRTLFSHSMVGLTKVCNNIGTEVTNFVECAYNYEDMALKHFSTKSTEEYINKIKRGFPDAIVPDDSQFFALMVEMYFRANKRTEEKIAMFEDAFGIKIPNKRDDVKIFMLCYSPKAYGFIDNSIITPLQCGAAVSGFDVCPLKDNMGPDNISAMNRYYVENSGTYWIWRNVRAKYIGQMQYGRRLTINENTDFDDIFSKYDVIVAKPYHFERPENVQQVTAGGPGWIPADTIEKGYAFSHCKRDLDIMELIIKKAFPDYAEDYDKYIKNGKDLIYSSGFVMPYETFQKYCTFLFTCLLSWKKTMKINKPEDLYIHVMRNLYTGGYIRPEFADPNKVPNGAIDWQTSLGGFFGERLLTLFVYHNCENIYYVDYEKTEDKPL